jgi:hypothetical protein
MGSYGQRQGLLVDSCGHSNESSGPVKCVKFLNYLRVLPVSQVGFYVIDLFNYLVSKLVNLYKELGI